MKKIPKKDNLLPKTFYKKKGREFIFFLNKIIVNPKRPKH